MGTRLYWQSYRKQYPYSDYLQLDQFITATFTRWSEIERRPFGAPVTVSLFNVSPGGLGFVVPGEFPPPRSHLVATIALPDGVPVKGIYQVRRADTLEGGRHEIGAGLVEIAREEFNKLVAFLQSRTPPAPSGTGS